MAKDILTLKKGNAEPIPKGSPLKRKKPPYPSYDRQSERLAPKFQRLSETMDAKRTVLQADPNGIDPEMVLIFEVIRNVKDFIRAASQIGMDFMGDWDEDTEPDGDFYNVNKHGHAIDTRVAEKLYLTSTDQRALNELLSLWRRYTAGETEFPAGLAPFKNIFAQLKDIRKWGVQERFIDTNVIAEWRQLLQSRPEKIRFEIELWFRPSSVKRQKAEDEVRNILAKYGGRVLKSCVFEQIAYHGLKVECPAEEISRMLEISNDEENELINADQIMWIRATGQMMTKAIEEEGEDLDLELTDHPSDSPIIALLDGLPMANHNLLQNRLIINDADGYEDMYPVDRREHATGMSSLIIHGDLNNRFSPLQEKVYVRPIMRPIDNDHEGVPDDELLVDVLHRAIKEIANSPELKSTIKIVNLSIGNANRPFFRVLSPEAKMLDWLSQQYNLLFVVSSGNNSRNFYLDMTIGEFKALSDDEAQKKLYEYIWNRSIEMHILSPAESINALTVGALNTDNARVPTIAATFNPITDGYPALYSCFGGGLGRSIKPDFLNVGGRDLYYYIDVGDSRDAVLRNTTTRSKNGPGLRVAVPGNGLNGSVHSCGTSNATALTSRLCSDMLKTLKSIPDLNLPAEYEAIAIKTMVVHSCRWGDMGQDMKAKYVRQISRKKGEETLKVIGYGRPVPADILCTDQRVTLIGFGSLRQNQQMEFRFPLPPCLISQAVKKRLTITLAWFSPINPLGNSYRLAKLCFEPAKYEDIANKRQDADNRSSQRGTVQHEVFEGKRAAVFEDGEELKILVKCKKEERLQEAVRFVLMATLETAPSTGLPIYDEVRSRLRPQVQVGGSSTNF